MMHARELPAGVRIWRKPKRDRGTGSGSMHVVHRLPRYKRNGELKAFGKLAD